VIRVSNRVSVTFRIEEADRELLEKICRARGESLSSFVRRALRMEFARLGFLGQDEMKAPGNRQKGGAARVLSEDDIRLIKGLVRETLYEILEAELYGGLFGLLDAVEGGIVAFKQQFAAKKGVSAVQPKPAAVKEETFACLKFEPQKGARIGDYEVAYKEQNLQEHWNHAYNILRQANATINNRYYGEGYQHSYWLYGEGRIYRQRLNQKQTS
jgi:hypothetical protein